MDNYLDRIVKCPECGQDVRDGDRIWLNGKCTCPDCYTYERQKLDNIKTQGYNQALKDYNINRGN